MKSPLLLSEEKNIKRGVEALLRALGPAETMRFLMIPRERRLESVRRHRKWQAALKQKELYDTVFGARGKNHSARPRQGSFNKKT